MLKKTIISAAILAATSQFAFANGGTYVPAEVKGAQLASGYYVGAGFDLNYGRRPNHPFGQEGVSAWYNNYGTVEGFAGYGVSWTNLFYTGLELFGTAGGINKRGINTYTYGARFMPGINITDNLMAFGNVGYVRGTLYPSFIAGAFNSNNKAANGIQFGAGLQAKLVDNVSLRGGWNRNYFSAYGAHPKSGQFYLSGIYHFTV